MKENGDFPSFEDFAHFITTEAEIVCNPVTSFHALRSADSTPNKGCQRERKPTSNVLHTQVVTETGNTKQRSNIKPSCILCHDDGHKLHNCLQFKGKTLEERRKFIKDKRLCYGCFKPGHSAKDCRYRLVCEMCKKKHPTCLHDFNYGNDKSPTNGIQTSTEQAATTLSLNAETNEQCVSTSMIVPVWVSSDQQPGKERLVYALLDTQSDTVFIDQDVSKHLKATSTPIRLRLTTMLGKDAVVQSERVSGLKVRGYNSSEIFELPPAYTKDCIPVNRSHIPSCETAKQWNHLKVIVNEIPPQLECEVGL
ncbi:uncharacterized protein LOC106512410, partial [Austrofundulus limnaeus]|uniref:Uncharacterized protein LOC106512410 n=1 Tax=Austrofundulus limnaeus TaxID=52670 RepID=A0A2I4ALW5_AUSLI